MATGDMLLQNVRGKWVSEDSVSTATNPSFENQSTNPVGIIAGAGPKPIAPIGPTATNRLKPGS